MQIRQHRTATFDSSEGPIFYRYFSARNDSDKTLFCVHGFDRTSRDFIPMASALSETINVVCPDVPGRGDSARFEDKTRYVQSTYVKAFLELHEHLGLREIDYFGTSMGGHIGLQFIAAGAPVRKLVLNDVSPFGHKAMFKALTKAIRSTRTFASLKEAQDYLRSWHSQVGEMTDSQWDFYTSCCTRIDPQGEVRFDFDPDVCVPLEGDVQHRDLYPIWRELTCPTLVVRGEKSQVLPRQEVDRMLTENLRARFVEIPEVGHAPTFMTSQQIDIVRDWLTASEVA